MNCKWWRPLDDVDPNGAAGECEPTETDDYGVTLAGAWPSKAKSLDGGAAVLVTAAGFCCSEWQSGGAEGGR
ncbi:MAG: hypothetical protein FJW32_21455 [Acidobacteria bacterium]|nr:hypothetical protein [Acidobacteriota bacterium]